MSEVFYTSDLHLGHAMVAKLRGFGDDVEAHDQAIVHAWEQTVSHDDLVYLLGDNSMSQVQAALDLIDSLPGRKRMILGNHDPRHPMHRQSHKWARQFDRVFESVDIAARRRIDGQDVLLSHFPYLGAGSDHTTEARYTQWRLPDEGLWLLHGHTHNAAQRLHGRQIHVGLDAWDLRPVAQPQVIELMRSTTGGKELV